MFVAKISASGDELYYSTLLGGNSWDISRSFILDAAGNTYVTGVTQSVDFPTTPGSFDRSYNANNPNYGDVFIGVINSLAEDLVYSTFMGGGGYTNEGRGVAVTQPYRVHVTGITEADSFPTTQGAFDTSRNGSSDGFVVRLDAQPYITNMIAPSKNHNLGRSSGFDHLTRLCHRSRQQCRHRRRHDPHLPGWSLRHRHDHRRRSSGLNRTDVAAEYGERFGPSGWELGWDTSSVTPGPHWLYLYAHRTTDNACC